VQLKDLNSFADTELLDILHHVYTRWFSLPPCIESILRTRKALCPHTNRLLQTIDQT